MQLDIRTGHAQTVDKVLGWLQSEGPLDGISVCDVRPRASAICARSLRADVRARALRRLAAAQAAWPSRWRSRAPP